MSRGKPVAIPDCAHNTPVLITPTQRGCICIYRAESEGWPPLTCRPFLSPSEAFFQITLWVSQGCLSKAHALTACGGFPVCTLLCCVYNFHITRALLKVLAPRPVALNQRP